VAEAGPWLVVGLGNPDDEYAGTRHNAGALVVGELATRVGGALRPLKGRRALTVEGRLAGERVVLGRPTSYMNESGGPVRGLADFFAVPVERIIVVHDDLDIAAGELRVKRGGGHGGHNGLRDLDKALGSKDYLRVRVGIGRPPGRQDPADYVLRAFSPAERKELPFLLAAAADAVESLLTDGLAATQRRFNVGPS